MPDEPVVTDAMVEAGTRAVWPWLYEDGKPGMRLETEEFVRKLLVAALTEKGKTDGA